LTQQMSSNTDSTNMLLLLCISCCWVADHPEQQY
jgi:hypothetical protein